MDPERLRIRNKPRRPALRPTHWLILLGIMLSAPFSFFPKGEVIALAGFLSASVGLALGGSLQRLTRGIAWTHGIALLAALALFFYHRLDLLYVKFMLSLVISFQFCLLDRRTLLELRDLVIYFGARGAALAIVSFMVYFAFDFQPFFRTLLPDERSIPFFGLTNINFGFDNPELIIFARPAFLFDEPGQFAHVVLLLLALIATAGNARRRWRAEVALLVFAGLATFSLAFLVVASIYLAARIRNPRTWLVVLLVAIAGYLLSDYPLIEALTWRLTSGGGPEAGTSGIVSGDNRSREIELAWQAFSENIVWGAGWSEAERTIGHFAASILGPLGYSGLLAIALYLPLIARLYRSAVAARDFHTLLVVVLVALFFSQRPYFYFPVFIFLMEMLRQQIVSQAALRQRVRAVGQRPARRRAQRVAAGSARLPGNPSPTAPGA